MNTREDAPAHLVSAGPGMIVLASLILVGALILAINFAPVPSVGTFVLGFAAIAVAAGIAFVILQRRAKCPLYDLLVAGRSIFWVAACAGIIVFAHSWARCSSASSSCKTYLVTQP